MAIIIVLGVILILTIISLQASSDTLWTARHIAAVEKREAAYFEAAAVARTLPAYITAHHSDDPEKFHDSMEAIRALSMSAVETSTSTIRIEVTDVESRFPLNSAKDDEHVGQLARLMGAMGIDPSNAEAVADWIDGDEDPRPGGGESTAKGTSVKNAPMDSVAELFLVPKAGEAAREYEKSRSDGKDALDSILFAGPIENLDRINVNTAGPLVLRSLDDALTDQEIRNIIESRPLTERTLGAALNGADSYRLERIKRLVKYTSSYFKIRVTAVNGEESVTVTTLVDKSGSILSWKAE